MHRQDCGDAGLEAFEHVGFEATLIDRRIELSEFFDLLDVELFWEFVKRCHRRVGVPLAQIQDLQGLSLGKKLRERLGCLHHIQRVRSTGLILEARFEELQGSHPFRRGPLVRHHRQMHRNEHAVRHRSIGFQISDRFGDQVNLGECRESNQFTIDG